VKIIDEGNKLTIQNFDSRISAVMLNKGYQYYNDGAILDIGESDGYWTAEVEGTDIYEVSVTVAKNQVISEYFCDCPYDGDICKHLVAVFFAIREEIKTALPKQKKAGKKNSFGDLLKKIEAHEYREFILDYSAKNKDFKISFELFFADKGADIDVGKTYADMIRKLIKKHSDRGFVDYRASIILAKEVTKLIYTAHDLVYKKNFKDAFAIGVAVMKEMMQTLTYGDDSSGSMGDTVSEAIELIGQIAESDHAAINFKESILNFLQLELKDHVYFDYGDFGYDLFAIYERLAVKLDKEEAFLHFIDALVPTFTGDYDDYKINFFKTQKINFLKEIGRVEEAEKLVQQNLDIVEVRKGEVDKAISKSDFTSAKKLIAEGIRIATGIGHPGTVTQWEKELLRIAVLENDIPMVRWYCKRFAFERWFDKQYYNQWKDTFEKDEWPDIIEMFIAEAEEKIKTGQRKSNGQMVNSLILETLAPVFIQEKYWDRLFAFVKNEAGLDRKMHYHSYLVKHYPAELLQLYLPDITVKADEVNDRSGYIELTGIMKMIIKDIPFGKEQVLAVARNLKEKYPRRPAMVDELNKLLKF